MSAVMELLKPNYANDDYDNMEILDWNHIRWMCSRGRSWKRVSQALSKFDWVNYEDNKAKRIEKVLPCDVCAYAQGWFFKQAFFNKKSTYIVCVSKKEMQNAMLRYMKFSDEKARKVYADFMSKWEDGMIFQISF